jgi:hypothetical protein
MDARGFFAPDVYAIPRDNVFFEASRAEKLKRIAALDCAYFIDDLEEVLLDPDFPPGVKPLLFRVGGASPHFPDCANWDQLIEVVIDG